MFKYLEHSSNSTQLSTSGVYYFLINREVFRKLKTHFLKGNISSTIPFMINLNVQIMSTQYYFHNSWEKNFKQQYLQIQWFLQQKLHTSSNCYRNSLCPQNSHAEEAIENIRVKNETCERTIDGSTVFVILAHPQTAYRNNSFHLNKTISTRIFRKAIIHKTLHSIGC